MDIVQDKIAQSTNTVPLSNDSDIYNSDDKLESCTNAQIQNTTLSITESDTSSAEYEIVSLNVKNTTKTTVINATCNIVAQSAVKCREENKFIQNLETSPYKLSNSIDKSRVVVQVLTSNAENGVKTQMLVGNKNEIVQNSNTHNFRDDILNILSKPKMKNCNNDKNGYKGTKCDDLNVEDTCNNTITMLSKTDISKGNNIKHDNENKLQTQVENNCAAFGTHSFHDDLKSLVNSKSIECNKNDDGSVVKEINKYGNDNETNLLCDSTNNNLRIRRKNNLKYFFLNGKGAKLSEIQYVASNLKNASTRLLRILHYVLFGTYGSCSNGIQLSHTRRNILLFCGYPFDRDSESFKKKKNCLLRLPFPILSEMHKALFKKCCSNRTDMVIQLIEFFMEPKEQRKEEKVNKHTIKDLSEEEYMYLKAIAMSEPDLKVEVKKLSEDDIKKVQNEMKLKSGLGKIETNSVEKTSNSFLPAYILKGPGFKMKLFPKIVRRVQAAKTQIIEILHYLLYGRVESNQISRRNILEFSGFLPCQKKFIAERKIMLSNMNHIEIMQLCDILCLHGKTNTTDRRIKKILNYLSSPCDPSKYKYSRKIKNTKHNLPELPPVPKYEEPCNSEKGKSVIGPRLRDFRNICSSIECAAPCYLTELNDLLFIKPCDESEIHQKILDFTRFDFAINSLEYHYRKTLMHYMSFCILKKIGRLLDIENWEKVDNQHDLSAKILNFLMEMKLPDSSSKKKVAKRVPVDKLFENANSIEKSVPVDKLFENANSIETSVPVDKLFENANSIEKSKSGIVEIYEKKTQSWCVQNYKSSEGHPHSESNKAITKSKKHVVFHKLSKSTIHSEEVSETNSKPVLEDSTPLRAILHHPSDQELLQIIKKLVKSDLWSLTMGDLVQKVYQLYPDFNLSYRETFIKTSARQILSELRSNAVDALNNIKVQKNHMQLNE